MKLVKLSVNALELCDRTRSRKLKPKEGSDIVQEYAEAYQAGLILEPLDVFCEKGAERYIVADGEHRLLALRRAKIKEADCRLREGGEVDALRFALTTNQAHGLRLTKEDRYYRFCRIKETALEKEFRTDRDLADAIGVSERTIQRYNVDWRNSQSGDKRTRRKKQQAQESAAAQTRNVSRPKPSDECFDDICHQANPAQDKEKPKEAGTISPSPKAVKSDQSWVAADEHAYAALRREWARATAAARAKFLAEVAA